MTNERIIKAAIEYICTTYDAEAYVSYESIDAFENMESFIKVYLHSPLIPDSTFMFDIYVDSIIEATYEIDETEEFYEMLDNTIGSCLAEFFKKTEGDENEGEEFF